MPPMELAREAIDSLTADVEAGDFGEYLAALNPSALAELITESGAMLEAFFADWPPIRPAMHPRIEPPIHAVLHDGRIVLKGRFDLALGRPGQGPVVITDFKTGIEYPEHREEVSYYALLETLRNGVPPIRVASYYLDGGWFRPIEVSEEVLRSAIRRTAAGVNLIAQLWWRDRAPSLSPGWHCRHCSVSSDCAEGIRWLKDNLARDEL